MAIQEDSNRTAAIHSYFLIHSLRDILLKIREKELKRYQISASQGWVLLAITYIQNAGLDVTPAEISRHTFRKPNAISRIVDRMTKQGLLYKSQDLSRKNLVRVSMTQKGEQAYQNVIKMESIVRIMSVLSTAPCQQFESCLQQLRDHGLRELGINPEELPYYKSIQ